MTMDIIGAGIGGLTTAIALKRKGIDSTIFEQAEAIKPVGAGIILANNAMQVYKKLGLEKEIAQHGNPISGLHITNANLSPISSVNLRYFEQKYQVHNTAIHRGKLQQILAENINKRSLRLSYKLTTVARSNASLTLKFDNGETVLSDCLLGADGLNSQVRNCLFTESKIRHSFQVCWRGITDFKLPDKYQHELNEAWGKGDRFGFVQLAPKQVYWYALKSFKQSMDEFSVDELNIYFRGYHNLIREIIEATPQANIYTAEISDLQPTKEWHRENVCLLGDAAHATTPNMGQGACQAIEDAYVLSECLQNFETNRAFAEYQQLRMPKAHHVVNTSWALGKLAHWKNPLAIGLRNQLMKLTPQRLNRKQSEKIFQLENVP